MLKLKVFYFICLVGYSLLYKYDYVVDIKKYYFVWHQHYQRSKSVLAEHLEYGR